MSKHLNKNSSPIPTRNEELSLMKRGYSLIAGLDEVGRGPLAGPVVAGIAVLPHDLDGEWVSLIRDSKQMTREKRNYVLPHLEEKALALEVGICSNEEIDRMGIVAATQLSMKRALNSIPLLPQFLLLDAITLPGIPIPQKSIIHGDALCLSIAAASIIAKVTRDRIMEDQDLLYPSYGFAKHKGYGTKEHLQNLKVIGPCPIHRRSFAPLKNWLSNSKFNQIDQ